MTSLEVNKDIDLLDTYLNNFQNREYDDYLDNYKKTLDDRKKCSKSKKCAFTFTVNKTNITKKKDSQIIYDLKLPKYILVDRRLVEIKSKIIELDREIRYLQNTLNLESDKKLIEEYKQYRREFLALEKEQKMLEEYLIKVNYEDENAKKKIELQANLRNLKNQKLVLYNQIQVLFYQKSNPDFSMGEYEKKIKEYLNNQEIDTVKKELSFLEQYSLKTDRLFFNALRDKDMGRINYVVEKLPEIKKNRVKAKKIVKSKSIPKNEKTKKPKKIVKSKTKK